MSGSAVVQGSQVSRWPLRLSGDPVAVARGPFAVVRPCEGCQMPRAGKLPNRGTFTTEGNLNGWRKPTRAAHTPFPSVTAAIWPTGLVPILVTVHLEPPCRGQAAWPINLVPSARHSLAGPFNAIPIARTCDSCGQGRTSRLNRIPSDPSRQANRSLSNALPRGIATAERR